MDDLRATMATEATSATGIIASKKPWPVTDGSHVYVRKFGSLGGDPWAPGNRRKSRKYLEKDRIENRWENRKPKCKNQESKFMPNAC